MIHAGIDEEDAATYTMHGCNWPDIPGKQRQVGAHTPVLPRYFLRALLDGEEPESIDDLYNRFAASFRSDLEARCAQFRKARENWDKLSPGPLRIDDCFLEGPIANARSWTLGGAKYSTLTCAICSIATAADCFTAVEHAASLFGWNKEFMGDLRAALAENFDGHESLRQFCLNAPKFGQDDDRADRHAVRVLNIALEEIERASRKGSPLGSPSARKKKDLGSPSARKKKDLGSPSARKKKENTLDEIIIFRCLETDMRHIRFGAETGTTPDGRFAGEPLSENTSPYPGSCTQGITAMFRSIAKLPLDQINSGALNVRMQPRAIAGEEGLSRLAALLRTYFDMGGLQVQISIADTEELRDAQLHPEAHRDLMVRITGYSAVFIDMCRKAQDEIIRRQEMEA
jgi:formate C-acetyltransferase